MKWQIDPSHTSIGAKVKHMVVSTVRGSFAGATGTIDFDPASPEKGSVELRIPAASIDTGDEKRDGHLRSADFLDAENHPEIVFVSTNVKPSGKDTFAVAGDLTIRGITHPASVTVELVGIAEDPQKGQRAAFDATATFDRTKWGLVWNMPVPGGLLVSEKITLEASVAATPAVPAAVGVAAA
jgi:polyisoprenoid-binding protein YceI